MAEPAAHSSDPIESRLEFETLLADLSSRFISVIPGELDREIEDAIRRVCEHLGIDYAVLWQWSTVDPSVIEPTHVYPAHEDLPAPEPLRQEQYPWTREQMLAGRMVVVSSLDELPAEAATDRENAMLSGIKSTLCLPMAVGAGPPVGALALSTLQAEREWPQTMVQRLQLVAAVFTNAFARKRHDLQLLESEERLALAADSAEAGLWTLDLNTGVFWATERARAIFGFSPDEVISMGNFEASVHPADRELVRSAIERSASSGEPVNEEYRIVRVGDGCVRWVASRGRPRRSSSGEPEHLMGVSFDITERKLAEDAFRSSEARLTAGADLAGLAFYEVDLQKACMYFDDRLRDLCGIPPDRELSLQALEFWLEHLHPGDLQRVTDLRDQLHDGRQDRLSLEYRFLNPTRGEIWIQHLAGASGRDASGQALRTYGVLRDITERKQAEEDLRELSQRLIRAHEEERALLARELHDDVTQRLAVLAIEAGRAELASPDGSEAETMRSVRNGLVRLSEDIHSLAYQLHSSVLDELGLAEALRTECERRGRRYRIEISVDLDPQPATIGKAAALCLFRVAQEALNNVARHSGASAGSVTLQLADGGLLLRVRDDGVGFDPAKNPRCRSLGLLSMRERVRLVNGTLDIESAPGRGTAIMAWVPGEGGSG